MTRKVSVPRGGPGRGAAAGRIVAADATGGRIRIRAARADDLGHLAEVETASFSTPWTLGAFRSLIRRRDVYVVVAEWDRSPGAAGRVAEVVGHGVLWRAAEAAELATLAVVSAFRGRGIAGRLLDYLVRAARRDGIRSIRLEVRSSNEAALRLYRGRGFRDLGVRRDYYHRPREDARVLHLKLGDQGGDHQGTRRRSG